MLMVEISSVTFPINCILCVKVKSITVLQKLSHNLSFWFKEALVSYGRVLYKRLNWQNQEFKINQKSFCKCEGIPFNTNLMFSTLHDQVNAKLNNRSQDQTHFEGLFVFKVYSSSQENVLQVNIRSVCKLENQLLILLKRCLCSKGIIIKIVFFMKRNTMSCYI